MFDHVTIRVADRAASERFYDTVLAALGIHRTHSGERYAEWDDFSLAAADDDNPATRGLDIGNVAPSREHADRFWRAGTNAGNRDDGAPGPRPRYRADYYGAFLRDPDGNSAEAVHHGAVRAPGHIDHLWIRVADVAGAKRFYETIAPYAGFALHKDDTDLARFVGAGGSFSLTAGTPTEHVHLAFPARDDATVDAFHRAATRQGERSRQFVRARMAGSAANCVGSAPASGPIRRSSATRPPVRTRRLVGTPARRRAWTEAPSASAPSRGPARRRGPRARAAGRRRAGRGRAGQEAAGGARSCSDCGDRCARARCSRRPRAR